jgi:hypothetical protein
LATGFGNNGYAAGKAFARGLPLFMGGSTNNLNGVLTPGSATNLTGSPYNQQFLNNVVFAALFQSFTPVTSIASLSGDSKYAGATTPLGMLPFTTLTAVDSSTPALPVSPINTNWSGGSGTIFSPLAKWGLTTLKPNIVVIEGQPNNWIATTPSYNDAMASTGAIQAMARDQGALVVLTDNYPQAGYPFNTPTAADTPFRVAGRALLDASASRGNLYLKTTNIVGITNSLGTFLNMSQGVSSSGLHMNLIGHDALESGLLNLIEQPYLVAP